MNAVAAKALNCFSLCECHGMDMMPMQQYQDAKEDAPVLSTLTTGIDLPTILIPLDDDSLHG